MLTYSCSDNGILAMTMGPGKHLKGRSLLGGVIKPEEVRTTASLILSNVWLTRVRYSSTDSTRYGDLTP